MSLDLGPDVVELAPYVPPGAPDGLREVSFRANSWLPDEMDTLRRLFAADAPIDAIAAELGRGRAGVSTRLSELGLRRHSGLPWTELDDAELARRYGDEPAAAIAQDLARSVPTVYARARLLGLTEPNAPAWTPWEDLQLRTGYEQAVPVGQLAALVGRPLGGVWSRAGKLGLRHPDSIPDWSHAECARALALAEQGVPYGFIRQRLADEGFPMRSKSGFAAKIHKLGYGRGWGRPWSPDEDALLRLAYAEGASLRRLAARLARSPASLGWRGGYLGLQGSHPSPNGFRQGPDWSEADMARLREAYGKVPSKALAAELGRGLYAMLQKANALGLVHGLFNPPTDEEMAFIREAWALPVSLDEVAAALGRKYAALAAYLAKHGPRFSDPARPAKPSKRPGRVKLATREAILALRPPPPRGERRLGP